MVIPLRVAVALSVVSGLVCLRPVSAQGVPGIAPAARAYLDHVLELLESESLNRARLDWGELRASAYRMAAGAQSPRDTYAAITHVVSSLGDQHSRFVPPIAALAEMAQIPEAALRAVVERPGLEPESRRADARVGYIRVPAFSGRDPADFARRVAERVLEVDGPEVCGWIVDVRGNGGGNMWPMLQGLLPILGEGVPGYFVYPDGEWTAWLVERSVVEGRLSRDRVAVAVLQDEETASSGEAVVVAFRGRPGTRTFGRATAGLSTANRTIELPDGARLLLAVAVYADRDRRRYGDIIAPDETLPPELSEETVFSHVQSWLLRQDTCLPAGT